jgi:hypothetical protein
MTFDRFLIELDSPARVVTASFAAQRHLPEA